MPNPLYDSLLAQHLESPKPFLRLEDGKIITFASFLEHAASYAHALAALGAKPGDRIAVQVAKSPEALALYAGCVQAGLIFLPLNTAYTPKEIAYFVSDAEPAVVVSDQAAEADLRSIAEHHQARLETLNADGSGSLTELSHQQPSTLEPIARRPEDLAALLYTSGTTGRSKGAMLTQANLLSNAVALKDIWHFTGDDVLLHALPIFHTHGLFVASNVCLLAGCQMIFLPSFKLDAMLDRMPQATSMMGVPTFYTRLLSDQRFDRELTRHMRLFVSGSAPLLAETHREFEARTGHKILERYGMTETNMTTSNPFDGERRAGTVGFPLPEVEVRVADPETGRPLPEGEIGVLEVKGPNVFQGYWRMPEKTTEEFREDGYFITGDLSMIDDDGYVHIVGRAKDLIISGGFNIYPKEVEMVLDALEGVGESAVIGVPHPDFGEGVVGVVTSKPGFDLDPKALQEAVRQEIARFKQPKKIVVINELPRNTMGKVQKNILREQFARAFTEAH